MSRVRFLRFLLLTLQLTLWGAAPVADAMLDAARTPEVVHIESHTQSSCPQPHPTSCAICHFLQTVAAPAHGEPGLPAPPTRATRAVAVRATTAPAVPLRSPLPRAPPLLS